MQTRISGCLLIEEELDSDGDINLTLENCGHTASDEGFYLSKVQAMNLIKTLKLVFNLKQKGGHDD